MKSLNKYINESGINNIIIEAYKDVYTKYDIIGELSKDICKALDKIYFEKLDNEKKIEMIVNAKNKNILIRNCKRLYATLNAFFMFIDTDWHLFFGENVNITIASGARGIDRPYIEDGVSEIAEFLAFDKDHKFNKLTLYRFNCRKGIPEKNFLDILNIDLLYFEQCKNVVNMPLPDKKTFKNKDLKFNSDGGRANTYFAENGYLVGTEEEVKSHMRKDFLKEYELNQAKEKQKKELIEASKQNPFNIYTYDYGEDDYCDLYKGANNNYILSWAFDSPNSFDKKWPENLAAIEGIYLKVDDEDYIIKDIYPAACGSFTGGSVLVQLILNKI